MSLPIQVVAGLALALAGWLMPRRVAGSRVTNAAALLLDLFPVGLGFALLLATTGRPLFAGMAMLMAGGGLALADRAKRATLREPVVFSDSSELPQVFTHPQLYLPFAGTGLVLGGAAIAVAALGILFVIEPELWRREAPLVLPPALVGTAGWMVSRPPLLGAVAAALRRLRPSGDPGNDMARLGPFATLLAHGMIAAAERPARRGAVAAPALIEQARTPGPSIVLVQCESFFDARRISPAVPRDLLPAFDALCRSALACGRLAVPGWGANTMRAEFAVLTGIADDALGLDRFNPYHGFVRGPVTSLAWRLRQQGYRTVCLHPFDRRFFRRDRVMPALGFEVFRGRESIGGARRPPYCPDPAFARRIIETLDAEGPGVFIFAITIGNHGPWRGAAAQPGRDGFAGCDGVPGGSALRTYLAGLRRSDEMIAILIEALRQRPAALLGFYGDHLPSLPQAFRHFRFSERASDYALWRSDGAGAPPERRDLPAHRLPSLILHALAGPRPIAPALAEDDQACPAGAMRRAVAASAATRCRSLSPASSPWPRRRS